VNNYPRDPAAGSPFRTGVANEVYPQFKRIAALFGDIQFNLVRRNALATTTQLAPEVPWWSYLATYGYGTPNLGSFHGLDIEEVFFDYPLPEPGIAMATYIISFVNHLNPNTISTASPLIEWPRWTNSQRQLINISKTTNSLIQDNFREKSYEYLRNHYSTFQM
jgi:carboxylesterase type B